MDTYARRSWLHGIVLFLLALNMAVGTATVAVAQVVSVESVESTDSSQLTKCVVRNTSGRPLSAFELVVRDGDGRVVVSLQSDYWQVPERALNAGETVIVEIPGRVPIGGHIAATGALDSAGIEIGDAEAALRMLEQRQRRADTYRALLGYLQHMASDGGVREELQQAFPSAVAAIAEIERASGGTRAGAIAAAQHRWSMAAASAHRLGPVRESLSLKQGAAQE